MKFTPDPTYEGLRIQANALARILTSREQLEERLRLRLKEEQSKKRHVTQDELESERAANARLTEELEYLRRRNQRLEERTPKVNIRCETVCGDVTGTTTLDVVRVEREDDGSFTAVTDHWPR